MTDNLVLWGEALSVHARGYIDFDRNLDFDVENKLIEPEKAEGEEEEGDDWRSRIQEIIVGVGKMMSKARLTGTLQKPKWKFQYGGGVGDILKGGLGKTIKDLKDIF